MKNTIIIITLFISCVLQAQSPIIPLRSHGDHITNGCYFKDTENELLPFTGTWVYVEGNKKVTLKFQRVRMHLNMSYPSYYKDILEAKYKLEINNVVIFNNINDPFNIPGKRTIFGGIFKGDKYLVTFVDDLKCGTWGKAKIWIENGKLHWDMDWENFEPFSEDPCPQSREDENFYDNMTLPWNMVLTKQAVLGHF